MQKLIILLHIKQLADWKCNQTTIPFKSQLRRPSAGKLSECNQTTIPFKSQRNYLECR